MTERSGCFRLTGGGNDFLALVEPDSAPTTHQIRTWCTRGLSLGADGLFLLHRRGPGARMTYFNADGRAAELCLNGTRCAARLALYLGWAVDALEIETDAGVISASTAPGDGIRIEFEPPKEPPEARSPEVDGRAWPGHFVRVGVPHFVVAWPGSLADAPVREVGAKLRRHASFGAAGTNVMFTRQIDRHRMEVRSFERGVEAETLACGTGVLAAVATAIALDEAALPVSILTAGGSEYEVSGRTGAVDIESWSLTGEARLLARIEIEESAERLPGPPAWTPA